jgi:hypothetical protein
MKKLIGIHLYVTTLLKKKKNKNKNLFDQHFVQHLVNTFQNFEFKRTQYQHKILSLNT